LTAVDEHTLLHALLHAALFVAVSGRLGRLFKLAHACRFYVPQSPRCVGAIQRRDQAFDHRAQILTTGPVMVRASRSITVGPRP